MAAVDSKKVKWSEVQQFMQALEQHHNTLTYFQNLVDISKSIPKEAAEGFVVATICDLHKELTKILKDNNILTANLVEEQLKMTKIIDSMATV